MTAYTALTAALPTIDTINTMEAMEAALKSANIDYDTGKLSIPRYGDDVSYKSLLDRVARLMHAHLSWLKTNTSSIERDRVVGKSIAKEVRRLTWERPFSCWEIFFNEM